METNWVSTHIIQFRFESDWICTAWHHIVFFSSWCQSLRHRGRNRGRNRGRLAWILIGCRTKVTRPLIFELIVHFFLFHIWSVSLLCDLRSQALFSGHSDDPMINYTGKGGRKNLRRFKTASDHMFLQTLWDELCFEDFMEALFYWWRCHFGV